MLRDKTSFVVEYSGIVTVFVFMDSICVDSELEIWEPLSWGKSRVWENGIDEQGCADCEQRGPAETTKAVVGIAGVDDTVWIGVEESDVLLEDLSWG